MLLYIPVDQPVSNRRRVPDGLAALGARHHHQGDTLSNIRSILKNKKPLISVGTHQTVLEAVEKMAENDIGAVLVLDGLGRVAGIFTERDSLQKVTRRCLDPAKTPVTAVMTQQVRYANPNYTIEDCLRQMTERCFRHLPVLDDNLVLQGMVSISDLVKALLKKQESIHAETDNFIIGSPRLARPVKTFQREASR